jgi:hypothetical protein
MAKMVRYLYASVPFMNDRQNRYVKVNQLLRSESHNLTVTPKIVLIFEL